MMGMGGHNAQHEVSIKSNYANLEKKNRKLDANLVEVITGDGKWLGNVNKKLDGWMEIGQENWLGMIKAQINLRKRKTLNKQ